MEGGSGQQTPIRRMNDSIVAPEIVTCKFNAKSAASMRHPRDDSYFRQSLNISIRLANTRSGFISAAVRSLCERVPTASVVVLVAIFVEPQFLPLSIHPCRDYAVRHYCEPIGPPLGTRTAKEAQDSLVQGQEKGAGCQQVFATRPTCRISLSSRQSFPSTASTSTTTTTAQSCLLYTSPSPRD